MGLVKETPGPRPFQPVSTQLESSFPPGTRPTGTFILDLQTPELWEMSLHFFKKILFIFRKREKEGEDHQPVASCIPQPGMWPATQACALTGNGTRDLLLCGATPSPLSHWPGQVSDFISHPVCAGLTAACVD